VRATAVRVLEGFVRLLSFLFHLECLNRVADIRCQRIEQMLLSSVKKFFSLE